jgi:hypothetical protein
MWLYDIPGEDYYSQRMAQEDRGEKQVSSSQDAYLVFGVIIPDTHARLYEENADVDLYDYATSQGLDYSYIGNLDYSEEGIIYSKVSALHAYWGAEYVDFKDNRLPEIPAEDIAALKQAVIDYKLAEKFDEYDDDNVTEPQWVLFANYG